MEELREKKVRVHGNFNGKLLADLLQEDLMEIQVEEDAAQIIEQKREGMIAKLNENRLQAKEVVGVRIAIHKSRKKKRKYEKI